MIKKIPGLYFITKVIYFKFIAPFKSFSCSEDYWEKRYKSGGNSGEGSYHKFAEFKAEIINSIVVEKQVNTVIEFGCGDGNQLALAEYPSYIGYDVSAEAVNICKEKFANDKNKTFYLMKQYKNEIAELALSLDVIYHLVEDSVFFSYMEQLFNSSTRLVVIYSSDTGKQYRLQAAHVKHRKFSKWIEQNRPDWNLVRHIPNKYSYIDDKGEGSFAEFYIYEKS